MSIQYDIASLGVQLSKKQHNMSELKQLIDALENIPMASFWSLIAQYEIEDEDIILARNILEKSVSKPKAVARFYPGFYDLFRHHQLNESFFPFPDFYDYDPFDSLDIGVLYGMNIWARREIFNNDRELFARLFSYAEVTKLEHHSPILIELAIAITVPSLTIILTYGLMRAVSAYRKSEAEANIREKEEKIKEEEYKQKLIQTKILEEIYEGIKHQSSGKHVHIPEKVLENLSKISVSTVSDLGESPLIGSMTFGVLSKSK